MKRRSQLAVLIAALLPASVLASTIEGVVLNNKGKVVTNATVEVEGSDLKVTTNENGKFVIAELSNGLKELHIVAPGYAHLHRDIIIKNDENQSVTFNLTRSPIEVIDIEATPIHMSAMESASPVSVLSGEQLRRQQAATLGDSLEKLPGVNTNFHGKVASTPIIRGLSGPRVLITQNGLDVSDVSRVGPDHSVASEASTAKQIEVLRGPATLFYGSGAIGGVVNVVDNRVPTDSTTRGEWNVEHNSADNQKVASFNATTGTDSVAFYADAFWREADDYEVPVAADIDSDGEGHSGDYKVENSNEESDGFTVGASYLMDNGFIGLAVEQFNRQYGIPGHTHGDEEEEHSDEEESVFADLEQTKVQLLGEYNLDNKWLNKVNLRVGHTDYEHAEIEGGAVGTTFKNETNELRIDLLHNQFNEWNGGISFHYKQSDVEAQGEEAFTPPSETESFAVALMEERHFGDFLVQLGGRIERVTIEAGDVLLPNIDAHAHDEVEEHDHDHEESAETTRVFDVEHEFTPISLSAGIVWDFTPNYNLGLSVSRSERAPSASELLSFGPHIGTGTYEVGALFDLDEAGHLGLSSQTIDLETANNIDLTLRKTQGDVGFILNAFYNQVDNYYYQIDTGLFAESGHDHGDEEEGADEHDHSSELPVYLFKTDDVILHGFETQIAWQLTDEFKVDLFSDYVRARLKDGGDLPRTPPLRFGSELSYQTDKFSAHIHVTRYQKQDRTAPQETATDGYTLVDASISYDLSVLNQDMSVYLRGTNLTDTEARVHSSFVKNIAPRPGRSFALGIRGYF
ncbi:MULTISPECIES: TonB-dependent receptor [unclassified Pseudoalteromonas]|uniref:TonB-dependent receptor n=1 Tax=unclassified Pseudoalteromonas TaxID=194690 RepID=UPI0011080623|nr:MULTISPECIES: TonB-dependent receptor [unclassified Pseudoalteromonas]TMN77200.1 TonB-dependent receptor [Pseudoalteromonas sp. S410]TMN87301.1 TonB-dependent receptor [Pseudoalteromonas sp. S408]TMN94469.1 TonB-dependent receptor [Pseudoalteromonas sp. S407]TMO01436.1 TonB-dependent receptor [Pseudoalteromonas sp. S409]TMO05834.1 TonB-dependent receptor [Pseudoalteromonas sp. S186]